MPIVELLDISGNPNERGEAHGEAMRDQVVSGVERWRQQMSAVQPLSPDAFISHILSTTQFLQTAEALAPDLLDEVRGIAAGANIDFNTMFAFQLLDECWWLAAELSGQDSSLESCSSLALRDVNGSPLAAQTMDLPLHYDGGQLLLRFADPDSGLSQIVFTAAGLVGLMGLNDNPLAVCVNTLSELACSRSGLPVAFVMRSLLAKRDLTSGAAYIAATPHASGQNYIITAPEGIIDIEAGAESVTRHTLTASEADACLYHTNHVLAGPLSENRSAATDKDSIAGPNSSNRLAAMARFFDHHPHPVVDDIKALLPSSDGPICAARADGKGFTFGACIMTLGEKPLLHITHGPPVPSAFVAYGF